MPPRCWPCTAITIAFLFESAAISLLPTDVIDPVGPDGVARLLIPSMHSDLKTCMRQTRNGDTVYFQTIGPNYRTWDGGERGWHSWQGRCFVSNDSLWRKRNPYWPWSGSQTIEELRAFYDKSEKVGGIFHFEDHAVDGNGWIRITGAPGVRVTGQLIMCMNTTGELVGPMTFGLLCDVNYAMNQCETTYVGVVKACVTVQGENWLIERCQVRSSGGTAVRSDADSRLRLQVALQNTQCANIQLQECAIGGVLAYDSDGRLCKAARGLSAVWNTRCVAIGCSIEHTEVHKYDHTGGSGVKVSNSAELVLEDSHLHSHDGVAVLFDEFGEQETRQPNQARVIIRNCLLKQAGVATFALREGLAGASLSVRHSTLCGETVWANHLRPGQVDFEGVRVAEGGPVSPLVHEFHRALFRYTPKNFTDLAKDGHQAGVEPEVSQESSAESTASSEVEFPGKLLPEEMLQRRARQLKDELATLRAEGHLTRADRNMDYYPDSDSDQKSGNKPP